MGGLKLATGQYLHHRSPQKFWDKPSPAPPQLVSTQQRTTRLAEAVVLRNVEEQIREGHSRVCVPALYTGPLGTQTTFCRLPRSEACPFLCHRICQGNGHLLFLGIILSLLCI